MKPKSRLYSLVKNWTKKPGLAVKEFHQGQLYEVMMQPESKQLEAWANAQDLSFELVLSSKDLVTEFVTLTPLEHASKDTAIDLVKDGIRAANYWHSFTKPHAIMLAMKAEWLSDPGLMNDFQEVLLKCYLRSSAEVLFTRWTHSCWHQRLGTIKRRSSATRSVGSITTPRYFVPSS
ncbi:MAG: hypothetical protein RL615_908 [Pseudomonadota bacterium]